MSAAAEYSAPRGVHVMSTQYLLRTVCGEPIGHRDLTVPAAERAVARGTLDSIVTCERCADHARASARALVATVVQPTERAEPAPAEVLSELGPCDLCAEVGIAKPATAEARLPGGVWASVCDAHAYRARSGGLLVASADDAEVSP